MSTTGWPRMVMTSALTLLLGVAGHADAQSRPVPIPPQLFFDRCPIGLVFLRGFWHCAMLTECNDPATRRDLTTICWSTEEVLRRRELLATGVNTTEAAMQRTTADKPASKLECHSTGGWISITTEEPEQPASGSSPQLIERMSTFGTLRIGSASRKEAEALLSTGAVVANLGPTAPGSEVIRWDSVRYLVNQDIHYIDRGRIISRPVPAPRALTLEFDPEGILRRICE